MNMAASDNDVTRVIFRRWKDNGDVIAVLLDVPANHGRVVCYEHVGQHGEGDWYAIVSQTTPATPEEYAALSRELTKQVGYSLAVRRRYQRTR
jgi:hypothetical protein